MTSPGDSQDASPPLRASLDKFSAERDDRTRYVFNLKDAIRATMREHGVEVATVEGRVKSVHSLANHLARNPSSSRREDLTAIRVVVLYASEMPQAVDALKALFGSSAAVFRDESEKGEGLEVWEFAYRSHHLKFRPSEALMLSDAVPDCVQTEWFEVQVRTMAAHLWGAIDHKLRYKTPFPLSRRELRTLFRVAAQLESIDEQLDSIRTDMSKRATQQGLATLAGRYSHPLGAEGIRAMIFGDPAVVRGLALATAGGWRLLSREGHEHQAGGGLNSPAEEGERQACEDLRQTAINAGISTMEEMRARATQLLEDTATIEALVSQASAHGLDPAGFPADLLSLLLRVAQPIAPVEQFTPWQDAIEAVRRQVLTGEES